MLRLLVALLALLGSGAGAVPLFHPTHASPEVAAATPASPSALVLDASALPGPTGWFLTRVTPDRDTVVSLDASWRDVTQGARPHASALVVAFAGQAPRILPLAAGSSDGDIEIDAAHEHVGCCVIDPLEGGAGSGRAKLDGLAGPTRPFWVGLVADGWDAGSELSLAMSARHATLHADAPTQGTIVQSYDLVGLARADGTEARVAGATVAGRPGAGVLHRVPNGVAFLSVVTSARGLDEATLHVSLPNGTPVPGHIVAQSDTFVQAVKRGPVDVRLDDVRDEPLRSLGTEEKKHSSLVAVVLYADIDTPLDGYAMSIHDARDGDG